MQSSSYSSLVLLPSKAILVLETVSTFLSVTSVVYGPILYATLASHTHFMCFRLHRILAEIPCYMTLKIHQ